MDYQVKLEVFEGPLDLLLHLIKKDEVDIYDIPIATITQQYLSYLDLMQTLNLEVAGEFLVMAATLIQIKSRLLLPPEETGEPEGEDLEDPREELVRRLLEYKKFKEAAETLRSREALWQEIFTRRAPWEDDGEPLSYGQEATVFDLLSALKDILDRVQEITGLPLSLEEITVTDKINMILSRMAETETLSFESLFAESVTRLEIIVTFLALLELVKQRLLRLWQAAPAGPIRIYRCVETGTAHERS